MVDCNILCILSISFTACNFLILKLYHDLFATISIGLLDCKSLLSMKSPELQNTFETFNNLHFLLHELYNFFSFSFFFTLECHRETRETSYLLYIDQHIVKEGKARQKNVAIVIARNMLSPLF